MSKVTYKRGPGYLTGFIMMLMGFFIAWAIFFGFFGVLMSAVTTAFAILQGCQLL